MYEDDSHIQHLDLVKIRTKQDADEWVQLRVRATAIAEHRDVFDTELSHKWLVDPI